MVIFGTIIGVALLPIQSITTSPRTSKIKRAKKGVFDDASWISLKDGQGVASVGPKKLLESVLCICPDCILLQELCDGIAFITSAMSIQSIQVQSPRFMLQQHLLHLSK